MSSIAGKRKRGAEHPYLTGNFAPVTKTHTPTPCTYTGVIPQELLGGQYVRNGGNPITNSDAGRDYHWFDGDGMLAGVFFQRASANSQDVVPHFVNQYVLTDLCLSSFENATTLRTPILPSIATLVNPISSLISIVLRIFRTVFLVLLSHLPGQQQVIKRISVANTNILYHDGRALATCESGPPIRVQLPGLETVGWFDGNNADGETMPGEDSNVKDEAFGGTGLMSFMNEWTTGHPKVDPRTGELLLFHCTFAAPYVHYSVVPPSHLKTNATLSKLMNAPVLGCSGGKMMHDFGVSRSHTTILDLPLTFTPLNLLKNRPVVSYDPSQPARFGVFPRRQPEKVRWFETEGCCIFHTANTWDDVDDGGYVTAVNMLACRLTSASLIFSAGNLTPPPHPQHQQPKERRRMSFFAKYDDDEQYVDPEKPREREPLLCPQKTPIVTYNEASPSNSPPILNDDLEQCRLYYYRFSLVSDKPEITRQYALSTIPFEFPTVNPAFEMSAARYIYGCSTTHENFGAALGKATKVDILAKMDVHTLLARADENEPENITGCIDRRSIAQVLSSKSENDPIKAFHMPEGWFAQEARFVSRSKPTSEDDGYLLFYVFNEAQIEENGDCPPNAVSELWIIDAKNMRDVVAKVTLPQRVPYGLHGNWFPEAYIRGQRQVDEVRKLPIAAKSTLWSNTRGALIKSLR